MSKANQRKARRAAEAAGNDSPDPAAQDDSASAPIATTAPKTATAVEPSAEPAPPVARDEPSAQLGTITIDDRVVSKIAARASTEIADAGAAAPRILGRSLAGLAGHSPGMRPTSLDALPKTNADVDGALVTLDLDISVRWPASVPDVTARVRRHVRDRVTSLTGLDVIDVRIRVTDLVTHLAAPPRVH